MDYIYVGKLVNTHGIKGEVRILSNFELKSKVFVVGSSLFIDKTELIIDSYRPHKNFDMVTFKGINNISEVLKYKNKDVYVLKRLFNENDILDTDLIGMNCFYNKKNIGQVTDIINNNNYKVIEIKDKYIPYNNNFIDKIDKINKKIYFINVGELL